MTQRQAPPTNDVGQWLSQASYTLLLKAGLLMMAITAVLLLFIWLIVGKTDPQETAVEHGLPVLVAEASSPLTQPGLVEMRIDDRTIGNVQSLDPPETVEIGGFRLTVSPQYLQEAQLWQEIDLPANHVGWLENRIINYVFRLPAGPGYRDILENAGDGQSLITLTTAQGKQFNFAVVQGVEQAVSLSRQRLQQNKPSITLLWVDANNSYYLTGDYLPASKDLEMTGVQVEAESEQPPAQLAISLEDVAVQDEGRQLLITGAITNSGLSEGIVEQTDIDFRSDDLVNRILSVNPPLPWRIPPNNSQIAFALTFQHPPAAEAVLTIGPEGFMLRLDELAE